MFITETIYRHEVAIGGEAVNFEILDTAGQVRNMMDKSHSILFGMQGSKMVQVQLQYESPA